MSARLPLPSPCSARIDEPTHSLHSPVCPPPCAGVVRVRFDLPSTSSDASAASQSSSQSTSSSLPSSASPLPSSAATSAPLVPSKRGTATRSFPRYGQPLTGRPLLGAGGGATGGRRPTANTEGGPAVDEEGRAPSPVALADAFHASPFASSAPAPPPSSSAALSAGSPAPPSLSSSPAVSPPPLPFSSSASRFDLFAVENDSILLALFARCPPPVGPSSTAAAAASKASKMAAQLLAAFHRQFSAQLADLRPTFLHMATNAEEALSTEELLPHFAAFTRTMEDMGVRDSGRPTEGRGVEGQGGQGGGGGADADGHLRPQAAG